MSAKFVPNPKFAATIRSQPECRKALEQAADAVAGHAATFARVARAPWMKRQSETIVVSTDADRVAVVNTDYAGHLMEWGGKHNPAHAPLRRAVRAAGLRFEESPKGAA
jgi:hypothetical protein